MKRLLILAGISVAALFLGSGSLAAASIGQDGNPLTSAVAPGSHEDDEHEDGHGPPEGRGRPEGVGPGENGRGRPGGPPTLPEHASPRAHAAVALAFERQQEIRDRVDQIRSMPGGPDKGAAVSELMKEFGQLYRLTEEAAAEGS